MICKTQHRKLKIEQNNYTIVKHNVIHIFLDVICIYSNIQVSTKRDIKEILHDKKKEKQ
jgi:hypothetical protein